MSAKPSLSSFKWAASGIHPPSSTILSRVGAENVWVGCPLPGLIILADVVDTAML